MFFGNQEIDRCLAAIGNEKALSGVRAKELLMPAGSGDPSTVTTVSQLLFASAVTHHGTRTFEAFFELY